MDYKKVNDVLSNLDMYYLERRKDVVASHKDEDYGRDLLQGDTAKAWVVIDVGGEYFIKITSTSNSYGETSVSSVQFVKGQEKKVTVYEFPG